MLVLTVDDSRTMREMLFDALSSAGIDSVQAVDGVQALEVLGSCKPDVIVTDINMPRLDGFGLIEKVPSDGRFLCVTIMVLSTESAVEKKQKARAAGATGWIVKPFDPTKLVDAIRRVAA